MRQELLLEYPTDANPFQSSSAKLELEDGEVHDDDEGKTAAKSFPGENQPLSGLLSLRR